MAKLQKPMLIFDLDGTLWDSAEEVAESWNIVFRKVIPDFVSLTGDDIHRVMGMTMREIRDALQVTLPEEKKDAVFQECTVFEVEYLREHPGRAYPDLRPVMEQLLGQGYRLAIVSNCQLGYISAFLDGCAVNDLFQDQEEWEHTGLTKGENIRLVMDRNGFDRAIYIGDTGKDEEAARAAGIPFIHAAYGFGAAEQPVGVIHSLAELPALVAALAEGKTEG